MKKRYFLLLVSLLLRFSATAQYSWNNVGSGMNSPVYSLATDTVNDILYAGGLFTNAGSVPAINIAKWDGVTWAPIGAGVISGTAISSLLVNGPDLYAGGTFTNIGGVLSRNIAKWDGLTWSPLGAGLEYTGATTVSTLTMYNGDLYAGGTFNNTGGSPVNFIAKWDGTNWLPLGTGTNGPVYTLCVYGTDLYAGGTFTNAGGVPVNNIAKWDGTTWTDVGGGVSYTGATTVSTLTVYNGDLYAGGMFTTAGSTPVQHLAKWDGTTWSDVGGGASNYTGATTVSTLTVFANELIVGGNIDSLGLVPVNYIGKWDGSNWSTLGSGTNNSVLALATMHDTLYAGGLFPVAGSQPNPFIAEWIPSPTSFISVDDIHDPAAEFLLYPNPADDIIYFSRKDRAAITENYFIHIYDMTGREIYAAGLRSHQRLDRSNIQAGLYIYDIRKADRSEVQKGKISLR